MRFHRLIFVCAFIAGIPAAMAESALVWNRVTMELSAPEGTGKLEADFSFRNGGKQAVTILSVKTSCGCTTAEATRSQVAPGESAAIRALFTRDGRQGQQDKLITVVTDEPQAAPTLLQLRVALIPPVEIAPRLLVWRTGESTAARVARVKFDAQRKIEAIGIKASDPHFNAEWRDDSDHQGGRIVITPMAGAGPGETRVTLRATVDGEPRTFVVVAAMR